MPLQVTGRHMNLTQAHKEYIDKKADRLRHLCPKIDEMVVRLTQEKLHYLAECNFRAGKIAVTANVQAEKDFEAIDLLIDKVESQVSRAKKKMQDKKPASREKARKQELSMTEELAPEPEQDQAVGT